MSTHKLGNEPAYDLDEADRRLGFLASSGIRKEILRELNDQELIERDLRDRLDAPRSTVHQNVEQLLDRGWIQGSRQGYSTTWLGAIVLEEYESCGRNIEVAERLEPLLTHVDETAVDLTALAEAEITASGPNRPNAATRRLAELIEAADTVRTFTPYVVPQAVTVMREGVRADDLAVEAVLTAEAAEALREYHEDALAQAGSASGVRYYRYDGELPFALGFVDGRVAIVGFDDGGHPRTLVETESARAVEWAGKLYDQYREAATLLLGQDRSDVPTP